MKNEKWISLKDRFPEEGKWVLGMIYKDNWPPDKWHYVIVKLEKGLTPEYRQKMKDGLLPDSEARYWNLADGNTTNKRSSIYRACDLWSNNKVPYCWHNNTGNHYFGQEINHWMELPVKYSNDIPCFNPIK
jgi:hypothetical protein